MQVCKRNECTSSVRVWNGTLQQTQRVGSLLSRLVPLPLSLSTLAARSLPLPPLPVYTPPLLFGLPPFTPCLLGGEHGPTPLRTHGIPHKVRPSKRLLLPLSDICPCRRVEKAQIAHRVPPLSLKRLDQGGHRCIPDLDSPPPPPPLLPPPRLLCRPAR